MSHSSLIKTAASTVALPSLTDKDANRRFSHFFWDRWGDGGRNHLQPLGQAYRLFKFDEFDEAVARLHLGRDPSESELCEHQLAELLQPEVRCMLQRGLFVASGYEATNPFQREPAPIGLAHLAYLDFERDEVVLNGITLMIGVVVERLNDLGSRSEVELLPAVGAPPIQEQSDDEKARHLVALWTRHHRNGLARIDVLMTIDCHLTQTCDRSKLVEAHEKYGRPVLCNDRRDKHGMIHGAAGRIVAQVKAWHNWLKKNVPKELQDAFFKEVSQRMELERARESQKISISPL